jgi:hypothetical protein
MVNAFDLHILGKPMVFVDRGIRPNDFDSIGGLKIRGLTFD